MCFLIAPAVRLTTPAGRRVAFAAHFIVTAESLPTSAAHIPATGANVIGRRDPLIALTP